MAQRTERESKSGVPQGAKLGPFPSPLAFVFVVCGPEILFCVVALLFSVCRVFWRERKSAARSRFVPLYWDVCPPSNYSPLPSARSDSLSSPSLSSRQSLPLFLSLEYVVSLIRTYRKKNSCLLEERVPIYIYYIYFIFLCVLFYIFYDYFIRYYLVLLSLLHQLGCLCDGYRRNSS